LTKISTISTTRISLNFLINQLYKLGIRESDRLGPLVDGVHRIAQAMITSKYRFLNAAHNRLLIRLPLREQPTAAEQAYISHIGRQINTDLDDRFPNGWKTVWVRVESDANEKTWPHSRNWFVEFSMQRDPNTDKSS